VDSDTKEIIEERMGRLRLLSQRLDDSITIPGTKYKIGVDPIIGLIPGGGDVFGAILSIYIMYSGIKIGVPRATVNKMFKNILLEFIVGCIPVVGDLFDIVWKSNQRNVKLIEESIAPEEDNKFIGYITILTLISIMATIGIGIIAFFLV
tara:strand:- start:1322 stop:1771 length:450 start_codon:yes stop_codon:yes gene_type:complete